jgi:hypothetical protein
MTMNTNEISCITAEHMDDAPDSIKKVDELLEWGEDYDGDMPIASGIEGSGTYDMTDY